MADKELKALEKARKAAHMELKTLEKPINVTHKFGVRGFCNQGLGVGGFGS